MVRQFEPKRALGVKTKPKEGEPRYGSAYWIGGKLVLTAAHFLDGVGSECFIRSERAFGQVEAKVVWKAKNADIALIQLPDADSIPTCEAVIFGKLPEVKTGEKLEFQMFGYPLWGSTKRENNQVAPGGRHVDGLIHLADTSPDGLLVLKPNRVPSQEEIKKATSREPPGSPWEGNSGAAIVCDGLVIAVQQQHQNPNNPESLEASPLWKIYDDEQWCELLRQHSINPEPAIVGGKAVCPYVGLSAFKETNKEFFYGRENLSKELAKKLYNDPKCLFVIGASGSGKTSVVQAGLFPELKLQKEFNNSPIISFSPKDKPQEFLKKELKKIQKKIQNRTIIFIDQFEELYALCSKEVQTNFAQELNKLIHNYSSKPITLIIAIRSDFYGFLQESCLRDWIPNYQVNVNPMTEDEINSAIVEPAKKVGLLIESGLVDIIIEDIKNINYFLPLLEFTLEELWNTTKKEENKLTYTNYQAIGKITGALIKHANNAFEELARELENQLTKESLEKLTFHVFTRLINYGLYDSPNTRRRAFPIKNLAFKNQENSNEFEIIKKIVKKFADKRLLVTDKEDTVEIVHDFLISNWTKLQEYIDKEGENLRLLKKIEQDAWDWTKKGKRKEDLLLQGSRLKTVEDLLEKENVTNEDKVADYLKACKDREEEEQVENDIFSSIVIARLHLRENKNLDALTTLIKVGERLQKLPNTDAISTYKKLDFLITFGQIFDEIAEKNSFEAHKDWISGVSISPDGQTIASSSSDKSVKIWSFNGNHLQTLDEHNEGHTDEVLDVSFSPDGEMLASGSQDTTIKLWKKSTDVKNPWMLHKTLTGHTLGVNGVSFSPDSQIIASASEDKTVRLWSKNGHSLHTFSEHEQGVINVAFSPDGKLIASASRDKNIKLWKSSDKNGLQSNPKAHFAEISAVSFGLDSKTLISSSWDEYVSFWKLNENVRSLILLKSQGHTAKVCYATFSPNGETIAAASEDGLITLWDKNGNSKRTFKGHTKSVMKVSFSSDSKTLVSCSVDKTIKIWDCARKFDGHSSQILKIDFSRNGEKIATASQDGTIKVWHRNGELQGSFKDHDSSVHDMKCSPDGTTIATATKNKVKIWSLFPKEFSKHESDVQSISFNPEAKVIAVGYLDGRVILWNIDDDKNRTLAQHPEHTGKVNMVTFSPKGTMIATASADKTVKLWDLEGELLDFQNYKNLAYYVSFSPDGRLIATASMTENNAHQIELWNADNNNYQKIPLGSLDKPVLSIDFILDSNIVAAISNDQTITLWNTVDGSLLKTIEGNGNSSISAAFIYFSSEKDKSAIVVANSENRISLWSLSLDELLRNSNNRISDYKNRLNYLT